MNLWDILPGVEASKKEIGTVCAGQIVSVCVSIKNGTIEPGRGGGTWPHLTYTPTQNETASYCAGNIKLDGTLPEEADDFYLLDFGLPFYCPWNGQLNLEWKEAQNLSTLRTLQYSIRRHSMPLHFLPVPTYSVNGLSTIGIKIPRGARAIQVPTLTDIQFDVFNGATRTINIQPGKEYPIGPMSQGRISSQNIFGTGDITFLLAIA